MVLKMGRQAAVRCGVPVQSAEAWFRQAGGVSANGMHPVGRRYLSVAEREEIAVGLAAGRSLRQIAAGLERPPSTVCREVARNRTSAGRYRALGAQAAAEARARRPKVAKLAADPVLRARVQNWLEAEQWSPRQISHALAARSRTEVCYSDPVRQEYRDLWIMRLGDDGRCYWLEEWPYWPERPYAAREGS